MDGNYYFPTSVFNKQVINGIAKKGQVQMRSTVIKIIVWKKISII